MLARSFSTQRIFRLLRRRIKGLLDEGNDSAPGIEAVPRLRYRIAVDCPRQRTVIVAGVRDQVDRHTHLTQRPVHLLRLPQWIRRVALTLQQEERRAGFTGSGQWALPPSIFGMLPWF